MSKLRNVRGEYDEIYNTLRRQAADDYDAFWETIHKYESKRLRENLRIILVAPIFGLLMYGLYYLLK